MCNWRYGNLRFSSSIFCDAYVYFHQYLLIVTISIEGRGDYFIATFPIQLLAGDSAELPSFAEATGQTEGQDDSVALPMYSVSQSDETFT
jgi:hypothetical protein